MSSVNFNSAATQALRTLQQTNTSLDATQKRISTGLAISEAKDNAAYWSISTTMQSDNKALGTVTDALGLGAATVDTAYQGLSAAKDVLNEIKSKLTAALGSNVDRTAIQAEIDALQEQLKSIASSSTFSGENWLSVNSSLSTYSAGKSVVASFTRDVAGNVVVGEIKYDSKSAVLFDANATATSKGILDTAGALTTKVGGVDTALTFGGATGSGNTSKAGLTNVAAGATGYTAGTGTGAAASQVFSATWNANNYTVGDTISFDVSLDSGVTPVSVSMLITTASKANAGAFRAALQGAIDLTALVGKVTVGNTGGDVVLSTPNQGTEAKLRVGTISAAGATTSVLGLTAAAATGTTAVSTKPEFTLGTYTTTGGAAGDKLTLSLKLGSGTGTTFSAIEVTLTDAMLDPTVSSTTGYQAFATALNLALDTSSAGKLDVTSVGGVIKIVGAANQTNTDDDRIQLTSIVTASNFNATVSTLAGVTTAGSAGADKLGTGTHASVVFDKFEAVQLDGDDTLSLTFGGSPFTVNKAAISAALTTTDGKIGTVDQMVTVLNSLTTPNYVASKNGDGKLVLTSKSAGTTANAAVTAVAASPGTAAGGAAISVDDIDITDAKLTGLGATDADKRVQAITAYINVVNGAINKVTAAATAIGSIGKRIDLQKTFVQNLMDTIDKGISGLVDADMNEESTMLQALQVKQQLGVQALSIANQSAQNVLSLFRG